MTEEPVDAEEEVEEMEDDDEEGTDMTDEQVTEVLTALESSVRTHERVAVMAEWASDQTVEILAVTNVLAVYRDQMKKNGFQDTDISLTLCRILDRIWPAPVPSHTVVVNNPVMDLTQFVEEDDDDDDDN